MNVEELIDVLEKVQHKEAKVVCRCTACGEYSVVEHVIVRHNLVNDVIIVELDDYIAHKTRIKHRQ